jgi:hypothetical protein
MAAVTVHRDGRDLAVNFSVSVPLSTAPPLSLL